MEKIASFTIDHTKLKRGVYVSRKDRTPQGETITTFDIRMGVPNSEHFLGNAPMHTIEHLAATYLRNREDIAERVIYFGPMGCRTGFYLILAGDYESTDIVPLLTDMYSFIADYEGAIPGVSPQECGNFRSHSLIAAKTEARAYLDEVLKHITPDILVYPA